MMLIAIKSNQTKINNFQFTCLLFLFRFAFVLHSESQLKAKYKNKIDQDVSRLMEVTICQKAFGTSFIE